MLPKAYSLLWHVPAKPIPFLHRHAALVRQTDRGRGRERGREGEGERERVREREGERERLRLTD